MRRLAAGLLALSLALGATPSARSGQPRPVQSDAVVRLLADLESALTNNRPDRIRALAGASLPDGDLQPIEKTLARGPIKSATVRERGRRPVVAGFEVLADVLVSRGQTGRIATWQLTVTQKADAPDRYEIIAFSEVAALDGLLQISLDPQKTYSVHNLVVQAPDLTLKMASGSAFVAEESGGVTALVLLGKGDVRFAPPDSGEQGQLRIFAGSPALESPIDAAFIRLNPAEFADHVSEHSLVLSKDAAVDFGRAQAIFADLAPRSFNLDLGDFTDDHWSIEPSAGSLVVEFRTRRFSWLTYTRSPGEPEDISLFDRAHGHSVSLYASPERLATRGKFYSEDEGRTYDVERYTLDLTLDPSRSWISGRGSLRIRAKKGGLSSITLKLAQPLVVSSVSSPNFGRLLALRIAGQNNILVPLPSFIMEDTDLVFDVNYSGRLDPQQLDREAIAVDGQGVPVTQDPSNLTPVIEPEKRYLYSSRSLWYPQGQGTDYATASLRLSVPSQYQLVASGSLIGVKVAEAKDDTGRGDTRMVRTVEYSADRPVRYLACVISRFVPVARQRAEVPGVAAVSTIGGAQDGAASDPTGVSIEVVATPLTAAKSRPLVNRAGEMIRAFAKIVGEAPYPDFTIAAIEDNLPGGHSPPYFAMLLQPLPTSPFSWANDPVAFENIYPHLFLAHEVAHQWWGQAVGWKNYHEQWLSEGMAQYFAVLYAGVDRGQDVVRSLIGRMRESAAQYATQGPISLGYRLGHIQNEGRVFRAIEYNKSAVVLHMLRRLIGDEAFFKGIRRFYAANRFQKAGTDDFRAAMEAETPIKLGRFFDRWITEAAIPRLNVTSRVEPSGKTAIVRIEQLGEPFDFPYTVTVQYTDGRNEDITIPVSEAVTDHTIELKGSVRKINTKDDLMLANFGK
ncbi:MAG TPA: M1 family aminopeptidase [Vicinamibacterales bacterium]|nr:M1 family aminopeptidase [Vicinamibacterales bacterium]